MKALIRNQYTLVAKTFGGLEPLLAEEMRKCGIANIKISQRAVRGEGDILALYRLNLQARTALKVLLHLSEGAIRHPNDLYHEASNIDWTELIQGEQSILVETHVQSKLFETPQAAAVEVKDAILDRFKRVKSKYPRVDLDHPDLRINLHINQFRSMIQADTSGASLHRRGYRKSEEAALLNELIAAAQVMLTGWDARFPLVIGPGAADTLIVEAALIARRQAPNLERKSFDLLKWKTFDRAVWNTVRMQAQAQVRQARDTVHVLDSTPQNREAAEAGLAYYQAGESVKFLPENLHQYQPNPLGGVLILPYKEREDIPGRVLVDARYGKWQIFIFAPRELHFSRPADRHWRLFQGINEFHYYGFEAPEAVIALSGKSK